MAISARVRSVLSVSPPFRFKKRASRFNSCVGAKLKGQRYSKPGAGEGGRRDQRIQSAFKQAVQTCK